MKVTCYILDIRLRLANRMLFKDLALYQHLITMVTDTSII